MIRKISVAKLFQWLMLLLGFALFTPGLVSAQDNGAQKSDSHQGKIIVKGNVSDADGPIVGANIMEKGKKTGTVSDAAGNFSFAVSSENAVIVISRIGYSNVEMSVKGGEFLHAIMQAGNGTTLSGVVVTALGITRSKKSLGYDVGQISGDDMNKVAQTNAMNSMAGKVSGVVVSQTGANPTSSVSVVIRGIRSLNSDNQPLFVIDGVPLQNSMNNIGQNNGNGNDVDYGNVISDINPSDIENISILKGPSAAALYGSRAGNGVVLITTKSGRRSKGLGVTFSSTDELSAPYHYFQNIQDFGMGIDPYTVATGSNSLNGVIVDVPPGWPNYYFGTPLNKGIQAIQWNSPLQADGSYKPYALTSHNNLKLFVNPGFTSTNSISVENSSEKDNYRFSYTNMVNTGIVKTSGLGRHNLSLNIDHKITKDIKLSSSINYTRSATDNIVAGNGNGVFQDLINYPASVDIRQVGQHSVWTTPGVQQFKPLAPVGVDASPDPESEIGNNVPDNPWFVLDQTKNGYVRNHIYGNLKASFNFDSHFSAFVRYSQDLFYENRETKISKSYTGELNGFYGLTSLYNNESNTDFLVTYKNNFWKKFDISASAGGNLLYQYNSSNQLYSVRGGGIIAPELFNVSNISQANIRYASGYSQKSVYSAYATASIGYNDLAYLDLTGRNDWSSTLPPGNNSYFYPSASLSLLLSKMINFGHLVNLAKLRGGWASVGKDTNPYNLYGTVGIGSFGGITTESLSGTLLNPNLKPEQAISTEAGIDVAMLESRLRFSGTIYQSDNKNQILGISTPASSGYTARQINAGLVRSNGIELQLGGTIIKNKDWTWDVSVNYTKNNTYVISLTSGVPYFSFWQDGPTGSWTYAKGQAIPNQVDSKGNTTTVISDGKIGQLWDNELATVTDKTSPYYGYPLLDGGGYYQKVNGGDFQHKQVVGNFNPKLLMGMQTSLTYKRVTLSANLDMRLGGLFYSKTYRYQGSNANLKFQENMGIKIPTANAGNIPAYLKSNPAANIEVSGLQAAKIVGCACYMAGQGGILDDPAVVQNTSAVPGFPIYDAAFYPGVYSDGNGGYIENLGDPSTTQYDVYEDATTNGFWSFAKEDMFSASYIKLRELNISVELSKRLSNSLKVQGISLGVYTRNVILWTKAKIGVDPEQAFNYQPNAQANGAQFKQGIEYYNISPWTIPVGFKLNVRF